MENKANVITLLNSIGVAAGSEFKLVKKHDGRKAIKGPGLEIIKDDLVTVVEGKEESLVSGTYKFDGVSLVKQCKKPAKARALPKAHKTPTVATSSCAHSSMTADL